MLETRSLDVQAISAVAKPTDLNVAAGSVAVVTRDHVTGRRIGEALSIDTIAVCARADHVHELPEAVAAAGAIVLADGAAAEQRKALLREATARFPEVPAVVIANSSTNGVHKALEAGAAGVVFASRIETTLAATIRAVQAGQVVLPRGLRGNAVRPALSHREKQTLALVVMGLTNREIASRLFLAESTVKTHMSSIFGKLGVTSRSEAVALVLDPEQKLGLGILGLSPAVSAAAATPEIRW